MITLDPLLRWLLIGLGVIVLLHWGAPILIPLLYSLLIALVLYPLVARLERHRWPRWLAIAAGLTLLGLLAGSIGALLIWELSRFLEQLPQVSGTANTGIGALWARLYAWLMGLVQGQRMDWLNDITSALPGRMPEIIQGAANALFGVFFNLFIIPVFTALLLYNRGTYVKALTAMAGPAWAERMPRLLQEAVSNYARFIAGMVQVYLIVGILNSIGFLLLGVPYAILFGMLTAVMTMIPYVGIIFSALLPISLAYTSSGSLMIPVGVIIILGVVQYLEANLIFPKVVGSKLGLSTLTSLVVIFAGGLLWGVAGMVLLLPLVSLLKLVSKEIPSWRPLMLLLGDEPPE
jgi:predicted PurR-regulated permease PerM